MTAAVAERSARGGRLFSVSRILAHRSLLVVYRVPSTFIPSIVFPVFTVVAFSGAFNAMVQIPGFPVPKMIDWILPMSVVQGCAFAGIGVGLGVARDIEGGFFDRLLLAPASRLTLVLGPMAAALARAFVPLVVVLPAGLLAGARLPGGALGAAMLGISSLGCAGVAAGWALGLALRLQSTAKAGPLMQIGIFVAVFLSTAQVPLSVMTGWLRGVARVNPMTAVLAMGRQGFIGGVNWHDTWPGTLAIALGIVLFTLFAVRGLRHLEP